ncbi:hypothetical protein PB2503_05007 [Parvularcula bermudensis HTCC2503]|uniref:Uncharacterized protein n=1 Tax=Parvularcula bermudensis (strain ATCC BAA-594 / HTCC2503 / KCTC 12087) TaxID=314260 RepID=E0TFR1_PARBH|nr:hypothetical protein [Parvularcula bermudensis]ADM09076.1 hypothetical protein PB2503_05007 [Parvularcula bermudensis HTCC2503]
MNTLLVSVAALAAWQGKPMFSVDDAAYCAAVYAFTLDAMSRAENVPVAKQRETTEGLAKWEYELSAAGEDLATAALQGRADRAVAEVRQQMPNGVGAEAAAARGTFLLESSAQCDAQLTAAYGVSEHPIVPFLRKAQVEVAPGTEGRGLR